MALSPIGEAVLIAREGRRLTAYRDSQGVLTIGVGITNAAGLIRITPGLRITAAECDRLAARAFAQYAAYVDKALHGTVVPQHVYDALVSVCYNIGPGAFARASFVARIKAGDMQGAKAALLLWRRPGSIVPRRQAEADQMMTPYDTRLPERVRGAGPIHMSTAQPVAGAAHVTPRPATIAPRPVRAPDLSLPGWLLACGRFLDALLAPGLPAH